MPDSQPEAQSEIDAQPAGLAGWADHITLSSGVDLRLTQPSYWAVTDVRRQMAAELPKPPLVPDPDRGRDEPNEADPDYRQALAEWNDRIIERVYDVAIITGTVIAFRPDGVPAPEDESWRENLRAVGVRLSDDPARRYLEWVKFIAAPGTTDWAVLNALLLRLVGTSEADVQAAVDSFRRNGAGRAHSPGPAAPYGGDGAGIREPAAGSGPAL